jgi:hypothetical protein
MCLNSTEDPDFEICLKCDSSYARIDLTGECVTCGGTEVTESAVIGQEKHCLCANAAFPVMVKSVAAVSGADDSVTFECDTSPSGTTLEKCVYKKIDIDLSSNETTTCVSCEEGFELIADSTGCQIIGSE